MTVKDLKDFLEECDDDMEVTVVCSDDCYFTVPADCAIREIDGVKTVYIGDEHEFI